MKKSYFYFILLFIHTNLQIKNKQRLIAESAYPFVLFTTNDYYYVITIITSKYKKNLEMLQMLELKAYLVHQIMFL